MPKTGRKTAKPVSAASSANNSAKRRSRGKPFSAGNDYRWQSGQSGNPAGRPKDHDGLRQLIQELASEPSGNGRPPRLVVMLRKMLGGKDARDHANILEHGYGKVPQAIVGEDGGPLAITLTADDLVRARETARQYEAAELARAVQPVSPVSAESVAHE